MKRAIPNRAARSRRRLSRGRFLVVLVVSLLGPLLCLGSILGYFYVTFARQIDDRLRGERARALPHVYARPLELAQGQLLTDGQLIDYLNDLGYAQRPVAELPGEFTVGRDMVAFIPRAGDAPNRTVRVVFAPGAERVDRLDVLGEGSRRALTLEPPLVSALMNDSRQKRRLVPLPLIPKRVQQAVLAIEDRRFYDHPGVDVIRTAAAVITNLRGDRPYLVGGSTLTQQMVKNFFLTPEKTLRRKLLEQFMAIVMERRLTKDEILELYLNEVYLGQRGSFAIHGVAEAARLFFGKDVTNLSLSEAATIAGVIQSPSAYSPFKNDPTRSVERRNVVLQAMADSGYISPEATQRASREPLVVVKRALDKEAPYFIDYVAQTLHDQHATLLASARSIDVYTTLDLHLQRLAQDAVRQGLEHVDETLAKRRGGRRAEAALIAVDPRTGHVLAFVGGRSYPQSQFNRAINARRQPGSVFKPFVYLAAFEKARVEGRTDLTAASVVVDEPTTFQYEHKTWHPGNYGNEYDGPITWRRALAFSRNVAAVKVAEMAGYTNVAALWSRVGGSSAARPYPSIALGVFEASPLEIATAYTVFPNQGLLRPLRTIARLESDGKRLTADRLTPPRRVAAPDTTYLVTNMMRSVMNEGTGASARTAGFTLDAAGKSGTTNDLRDAWFVGFTPELLTVVWVGLDDNQPIGLSGSQAALPIWTSFMSRALSGHADRPFPAPDGVTFLNIDRETGKLAGPGCPRPLREAFLVGTQPMQACTQHQYSAWYNR